MNIKRDQLFRTDHILSKKVIIGSLFEIELYISGETSVHKGYTKTEIDSCIIKGHIIHYT